MRNTLLLLSLLLLSLLLLLLLLVLVLVGGIIVLSVFYTIYNVLMVIHSPLSPPSSLSIYIFSLGYRMLSLWVILPFTQQRRMFVGPV